MRRAAYNVPFAALQHRPDAFFTPPKAGNRHAASMLSYAAPDIFMLGLCDRQA